jgi:hypothetical protein
MRLAAIMAPVTLVVTVLGAPLVAWAAEPSAQQAGFTFQSATKARDIDGIRLGMTLDEVSKRMKLTPVGTDQFSGTLGNVQYAVAVTPLGRVFRVAAMQPLGRVAMDADFNQKLNSKLVAKYGAPANGIEGRYWDLVETIRGADGRYRRTVSNSFSVNLVENAEGFALTMTMLDSRYLRTDRAKAEGKASDIAFADASF